MNNLNEIINKFLQIASEREHKKQMDSDMTLLMQDTSHMTDDDL